MRLNKFLASAGIGSRRKCDEIISSGEILINGQPVDNYGIQVDENKDVVEYKGKILKLPDEFIYLKLNKPKGYICTAKDDRGRKTIFDLIKMPNVRLFSIGRLDYNTEGLILLTNNGVAAQVLAHPSFEVEKEYYCTIKGDIKESELAVLRSGVVVDNKRMPKAKVNIKDKELGTGDSVLKTRLSVKIKQGINKQIRNMFAAISKDIILLKRVAIAEIKLGGLKRGAYKQLSENEIEIINNYISGNDLKN
ncbi:MAG: pseudouridine synthase [Clostridia bacterium]|jgi:23S rRNA pseudouridine2605 synthase|nr:pseudouridine synthase [Clostridia bacterium]MDD3232164.1 pseudouridine synthase [Clostridia bacterium]MDD3862764.1 pseudouridine synthase [Clostridia bacterium]MDD4408953.1 pseudouridine synthase [Clostridia bacterium]